MNASPTIIAAVEDVRAWCHEGDLAAASATFDLDGGEMTIDYRPGDWLRITIQTAGAMEPKTYALHPDWDGTDPD